MFRARFLSGNFFGDPGIRSPRRLGARLKNVFLQLLPRLRGVPNRVLPKRASPVAPTPKALLVDGNLLRALVIYKRSHMSAYLRVRARLLQLL